MQSNCMRARKSHLGIDNPRGICEVDSDSSTAPNDTSPIVVRPPAGRICMMLSSVERMVVRYEDGEDERHTQTPARDGN